MSCLGEYLPTDWRPRNNSYTIVPMTEVNL